MCQFSVGQFCRSTSYVDPKRKTFSTDNRTLAQFRTITMSFSSLLAQVKKGKTGASGSNVPTINGRDKVSPSPQSIDPAVARLKEARRLERERLEEEKRAKKLEKAIQNGHLLSKPNAASKVSSSNRQTLKTSDTQPKRKSTSDKGVTRGNAKPSTPISQKPKRATSPAPKLSFKELMKQAEKIDATKQAFNPLLKTPQTLKIEHKPSKQSSPDIRTRSESPKNRSKPINVTRPMKLVSTNRDTVPNGVTRGSGERQSVQSRFDVKQPIIAPAPFAKPSEELQRKLQNRRSTSPSIPSAPRARYGIPTGPKSHSIRAIPSGPKTKSDKYDIEAVDSDDEEFDGYEGYGYEDSEDFIEYDEEEAFEAERQRRTKSPGYDRDEIWSIFNRGRGNDDKGKRRYEDFSDDDDMEASVQEIYEEEARAARQARLDDMREQKLLEKHAMEKRERLKKAKR